MSFQDYTPDDYKPMFFHGNIHSLKTATIKSLNQPASKPHIKPLWLSELLTSQIYCIDCEVDTGADCNVIPLSKAKELFGKSLKLDPPTLQLRSYNNVPVKNFGSCFLFLYHGEHVYKVKCEVAESNGPVILGREQALKMNYVQFLAITKPVISTAPAFMKKTSSVPAVAVAPVIKQTTSNNITIKDKTNHIPTSKEYLLKEYKDVFEGIGTLPGGPYHIQLKGDYKAVQHPPRQVAVSLKTAYQAELQRLLNLGVIAEVKEHTEWINSVVPVKIPDGTLRLCLDPKDLNKAIHRNQWYSRTIDDILPELAESSCFTLLDAASGFWHVLLDHESSVLTTFNTPWGKYRWLRLPFGLKISGDVFQERLDRVLRNVPKVTGIADDVLCHGKTVIQHDIAVITLLETARATHLVFNPQTFVFRSRDCKFFGGHLTPEGYRADPKKIDAISKMKPPQSLQDLQSYLGLVNYLSRFSPRLAEATAPLRELCKKQTVFVWESSQQQAFDTIKELITNTPVLAYFDKTKSSVIQSDASRKGLGAVLLQDGKPVIYASRSITEAEKNYSNIERELLSVVFALERLHHYVYGYTVIVQTDHLPLVSIWKKSIAANSTRLQRLLLRLSQHDIDLQYLRGKDNVIADALSRVSPLPLTAEDKEDSEFIPVHMLTAEFPADAKSIADFRKATAEDMVSSLLMKTVMDGWPDSRKDCHPLLMDYWNYRDEVSAENGLLFKGCRLIVPANLRNQVLHIVHKGHFGIEDAAKS